MYIAYLCFPSKSQSPISPLWTLIYLVSFSTHFGAQIWMTFVSGLALYFSLPRHVFGNVQKVLFPKYFLLNSILSLVTLAIFLRTKNQDLLVAENAVQVIITTMIIIKSRKILYITYITSISFPQFCLINKIIIRWQRFLNYIVQTLYLATEVFFYLEHERNHLFTILQFDLLYLFDLHVLKSYTKLLRFSVDNP